MKSPRDRWGRFAALARGLPPETFALVDRRLAGRVGPALTAAADVAIVTGGEAIKTLATAERLLRRAAPLSRQATFLAVGGGTVGDLGTVVAHLHKRGGQLIQVPTTLLAAVDSSLGGKGAVNLGPFKNGAGVFHEAREVWLCEDLWASLTTARRAEGRVEAWKMVATLEAATFRRWVQRPPPLRRLVTTARRLKRAVCAADPWDLGGGRARLNFGHTFGHALEGLSHFRLAHGEAVRLGIACALDVGRALGRTPAAAATEVLAAFDALGRQPVRAALAQQLRGRSPSRLAAALAALLAGDKKGTAAGLRMVVLTGLGEATLLPVAAPLWHRLLPFWQEGRAP